jgi:hypothetical protein
VKTSVTSRAVLRLAEDDRRTPGPNHRFCPARLLTASMIFGSAVRICFTLALAKKLITLEN